MAEMCTNIYYHYVENNKSLQLHVKFGKGVHICQDKCDFYFILIHLLFFFLCDFCLVFM